MTRLEIVPELSECIETKARKEYQRISSLVMQENKEVALARRLELLRVFLESADFPKLRCDSERLIAEGKRITFVISHRSGRAVCKMEVG